MGPIAVANTQSPAAYSYSARALTANRIVALYCLHKAPRAWAHAGLTGLCPTCALGRVSVAYSINAHSCTLPKTARAAIA